MYLYKLCLPGRTFADRRSDQRKRGICAADRQVCVIGKLRPEWFASPCPAFFF